MSDPSPEVQLEGFLTKYTPGIAAEVNATLERVRALLPGAVELVYDNYNALVIGFGATERPSEAVLSVVAMPRWVVLYFLQGASLPDPHGVLAGSGTVGRHLRLGSAADVDRPEVRELVDLAVARSPHPFDASKPGRMIIQSISAKQRPRRPKEPAPKPRKKP